VIPVAVWGWRLITHRSLDREWLRLILWIAAIVVAAAFASCLP
jgi:S-DNA-T family DNA segregation ATPase FtsK/SpoIIIE